MFVGQNERNEKRKTRPEEPGTAFCIYPDHSGNGIHNFIHGIQDRKRHSCFHSGPIGESVNQFTHLFNFQNMVVHSCYTYHDMIGALMVGGLVAISFTRQMGRMLFSSRRLLKIEKHTGQIVWINVSQVLSIQEFHDKSRPHPWAAVIEIAGVQQRELVAFVSKKQRDRFIKQLNP